MNIGYAVGGPAHGTKLVAHGNHDHLMVAHPPDLAVYHAPDEPISPTKIRYFIYTFDPSGFWWLERETKW